MANKSISVLMIKDIIRLKNQKMSNVRIAHVIGTSRTTVIKYLKLIEASEIDLKELMELDDQELHDLFECNYLADADSRERYSVLLNRFPGYEKELKRPGVSRWLLWAEYKNEHPDGYSYSQFCYYYQVWKQQQSTWMHQEHKAGDKMFVDFAGKKLSIVDKQTGEIQDVEVLVAILGASQMTYVQAVFTQNTEDFIKAIQNAFWYFGGVTSAIVPDNLKPAVIKSNRYEPQLSGMFSDFARHYNTAVLPARVKKPKDKALVEGAVKIVYHRIYAALRNKIFHSLSELNDAIRNELGKYNNVNFQGKDYGRRQLFLQIEKEQLKPLPQQPYVIKHIEQETVYPNYHIYLKPHKHYYSVHHRWAGKKVRVIFNSEIVEIYYNYERIAVHQRGFKANGYTTIAEHMPSNHNFYASWSSEKFIKWAGKIGTHVQEIVREILKSKPHPEQGFKSCLGILSMEKKVGKERLDKACERALEYHTFSYMTIKNILEKGLDRLDEKENVQLKIPIHENIRGGKYYT